MLHHISIPLKPRLSRPQIFSLYPLLGNLSASVESLRRSLAPSVLPCIRLCPLHPPVLLPFSLRIPSSCSVVGMESTNPLAPTFLFLNPFLPEPSSPRIIGEAFKICHLLLLSSQDRLHDAVLANLLGKLLQEGRKNEVMERIKKGKKEACISLNGNAHKCAWSHAVPPARASGILSSLVLHPPMAPLPPLPPSLPPCLPSPLPCRSCPRPQIFCGPEAAQIQAGTCGLSPLQEEEGSQGISMNSGQRM